VTDQVHHRAGRLAAADAADQRLTGSRPDDADAWHLTGLREAKRGQHQTAIEHIERAIALRPGYPEALNNLGNLLHRRRQFGKALALRARNGDYG